MLISYEEHMDNVKKKLEGYADQCRLKNVFHRKNANNGLAWHNTLGVFNVLMTSTQALAMTLQTINQNSSNAIAITGAAFALVIAVSSRVEKSYAFNEVSIHHHNLADDFEELLQSILIILNDIDRNIYDERELEIIIKRFVSITEKTHVQPVSDCLFLLKCM